MMKCDLCGVEHNKLGFAIPVDKPTEAARIPANERAARIWTNGELYVIDDRRFFIYGSIEIPIIQHHEETFIWGAWAEITEPDFMWYQNNFEAEERHEYELDGKLATDIPFYPPTEGLAVIVQIEPIGERPMFHLEKSAAHELIDEQQTGISINSVQEIKDWFENLQRAKSK